MSNFTRVKLIFHFVILTCFTFFILSVNSAANNIYVVQIAASKNSIDIKDFAKQNLIEDHIIELADESWYRYLVGAFENYDEASAYANQLVKKTKLSNVFVKVVESDSLNSSLNQLSKDTLEQNLKDKGIVFSDTIQAESKNNNHFPSEHIFQPGKPAYEFVGDKFIKLFVKKDKLDEFKNQLNNYGNKHVPQFLKNFYFSLIEICFQYPATFIVLLLIAFFIVNLISVLFILNYTIKRKNRKERYVRIYGTMYENALLSHMFGEIDWEKVVIRLKKIKRRQNRKILISILLNLHENLKGEVDKFIPEIYSKLGLYNDSFKAAKSSFTYKKVRGIRELTYLYSDGAREIIPGMVNYKQDVVRAEAQMAYITLNEEYPFEFLSSLTESITRWTQLSAFYLLRLHQLPVPSFADYLYTKHPTVRNFSLQMIIYFQQLENVSEIFNMLKSERERTRFLCYKAINDLRLEEGRIPIKNNYRAETNKNKLEIVKAFKNIGIAEDFEFLEEIINTESVSLKTEACRSMHFMSPEGRERLIQLSKETNPELEHYIAHITDSRN